MTNLEKVQQDGYAIKDIKKPSKEVQLAAVQQNGCSIQYIENPSKEVQLEAVRQNGLAIYYIENPSMEVQLEAVRQDGRAIQFIENPSEEVQLAAVRQDRSAIEFIKKPSEEVQLAAVQQNGKAIDYIENPSEEVKLAAVQRDRSAIEFIKKPSMEDKFAAISQTTEKTQATPHPHADMITEWVKDTNRIVQSSVVGEHWTDCPSPTWCLFYQYRFADSVKPTIRSSLSDWELKTVIGSSLCDVEIERYRAIADAAAAKAIEDIPNLEVRIGEDKLSRMYRTFDGDNIASLMAVVAATVEDCNRQLGKLK